MKNMKKIIKNGTIVNSYRYVSSRYIELKMELFQRLARHLKSRAVKSLMQKVHYIFPGGIDPHTHLDMPFGRTPLQKMTLKQVQEQQLLEARQLLLIFA